jgi:hypothetical protein
MRILLLTPIVLFLFVYSAYGQNTNDSTKQENEIVFDGVGVITLNSEDLNSDTRSQDISGLLSSSSDIFVSRASYNFSQARFQIRGYDGRYTKILINNMEMNNMESGRAYWSNWGGLNDVFRNKVISVGLNSNDYGFGSIGGLTNITLRASQDRPQTSVSYSLANRSYNNRVMVTHSTGLMDNGWAFTFSASKRWAMESYVQGAFYDAYGYFLSAEKKLNEKHSIGLVGFGAPSRRGKSGVSTQEVYDLAGNNFYNPYWGYQNGEVRNSRVSNYHKPKILLNHFWEIDDKQKLTSGLNLTFGRGGSTRLNWYDAADPRPDYYKLLPSYWENDPAMYEYYSNIWGNENPPQLDWDHFYFANSKNLYTVTNVGGVNDMDITGNRAKYMLEEDRTDVLQYGANTAYFNQLTENISLNGALNLRWYKGHHYLVVADLLGADYWLDIDQFAERDFADDDIAQNDIDNPNNVAGVGDIIGFDYVANINSHDAFAQANFNYTKFDAYASAKLSYTEFWRTGNRRNGKFPVESFGDSPKNQFFDYGIKAGVTYKITGRHFLILNAANLTEAPYFWDAYVSARTRDHVVNNLVSEKITSMDFSYIWRAPYIDLRLTGYYTDFQDGIKTRAFYHDELNSFVNYSMTGIDKLNYGAEIGLEVKITPTISANAAGSWGQFIYNNRPSVTITQDNDSKIIAEDRTVYIENYHVGNMPELAGSIGLKYNSPKYWFLGVDLNYFDNIYLDFSPDRRTVEALENYVESDPQWNQMLDQIKLDAGYTLNLFGGKSFRFGDYSAGFTLSVNNILDVTNLAIGGFEQYRYDTGNIDKFPPKYFYMYGRTYFLNMYFRF